MNPLRGLRDPATTGDPALLGRTRAVADPAAAAARLARVLDGAPVTRGAPERDAVVTLQRALVILGFSTSRSPGYSDGAAVIDGDFGAGTERGLRQMQAEAGLGASGAVDAATLETLDGLVLEHLGRMDADERTRQRDVLDGTIRLAPADLKRDYRQALAAAAAVGGVKEEVLAAITVVESAGGGHNRPKFESHHFAALQDAHDALAGAALASASPQRLGTLAARVASLPMRPGDNGQTTALSRTLLGLMTANSTTTASRRAALRAIQDWTARDLRVLATSWGWGQIMGWHTLRPDFRSARLGLDVLASQHPGHQIDALGLAIALEPAWRAAAKRADATGDYSAFAQAYNGAVAGSAKNAQYAAAMRQAAAEYRQA